MKKQSILSVTMCFLVIAICLLTSGPVKADPPQDLSLRYDPATQTLSVTITHPSTFTGLHYIKRVEIKKNNQPVGKNDYTSQPGKKTFSYPFNVQAVENDLLEVTVFCNIQGQKAATLKVESQKP